ncbi:ribose 5-phosphate isomerase B [Gallicola sp. Sow4_E12]|uniref:ribose 5-phosphate isomerase B n=1 Tax=Gallicola sp. Sow4_E12 TaxID=3438785 RepID=UPI003F8DDAA7
MKIAIASDHGGFDLKDIIVEYLKEKGYEVTDYGISENKRVDYPDYAALVADGISKGKEELGILICGTGLGMSIAANKISGIRAACVSDSFSAKMAREHNNANILCFGGRVVGDEVAKTLVDAFLEAEFAEGRHSTRVDKIMSFEKE